jgi:ribose transport system substrate-binding protein
MGGMKKLSRIPILIATLLLAGLAPGPRAQEGKGSEGAAGPASASRPVLVYGCISPGPAAWSRRAEEGFRWAARMVGAQVIVLSSGYDARREAEHIESLIARGVDGLAMFSFNQQGAIVAARRANQAGIPLVAVDSVGQVLDAQYGVKAAAAIDFDWAAMGRQYADYMARRYPGALVAVIAGLLEHRPARAITEAMQKRMEELGVNEIVAIVDGESNPSAAVDRARDLIQSGQDFDIFWIMDEEMAAAVIRDLEEQNRLGQYAVIAQNGSPAGIPLLRRNKLDYTISSSPGWEGMIALLALHHYAANLGAAEVPADRRIILPATPVTRETIDDPTQVVPWQPDPVWIELTRQYFPDLGEYLPEPGEVPPR